MEEKEIRIKYTIVLYQTDGTVKHTRTARKRKIIRLLRQTNYSEAHIVAEYQTPGGRRLGSNRWICTPEDAMKALGAFSEHELIGYLGDGQRV